MTTTTETPVTSEPIVPAAVDAVRTVPLSAILEFQRETDALGDVLDAVADEEDLGGDPGCDMCVGDEIARLITDPTASVSASFATETRLVDTASVNPECSCPPLDAPCSSTCEVSECISSYSAHNGG